MYIFLFPLILGFASNLASAFTTTYSEWWGKRAGTFITILLRDVFGIPVWAIGFVLAIRESLSSLSETGLVILIVGCFLILAGSVIIIVALISLRLKAAAPSVEDQLIKTGIYSLVRHPIHCGTALEFIGLFVILPELNVGISVVIGFLWIYFQTRLEERDLVRRIPEYKNYMSEVPGFIPKIFISRS
jgi:protein-S-isoprenylcysteine O-methyltransferase Ste14